MFRFPDVKQVCSVAQPEFWNLDLGCQIFGYESRQKHYTLSGYFTSNISQSC